MSDSAPNPDTVPGRLARRVADSPTAVAFQYEAAPGQWVLVTWADFAQRVECLRRGLAAAGLRKGDRLALVAPVSLEWEVLHHAALAMGVVVVGLDAHDLPARIAGMVELADITAFATTSPQVLAKLSPERWARCRLALQLERSGQLSDAWPSGAKPKLWSELVDLGSQSDAPVAEAPASKDTATIIFTSGTTGDPKGIAYQHSQLCLAIDAIADAFPFVGPGSRLLCWLPLSNLFQRIVNLAAVRVGAATYLLGDPRRVMDVVAVVSPDIFVGVPRFYEKLQEGIRNKLRQRSRTQQWLVACAWAIGRRYSRKQLRGERPSVGLRWAHTLADRVVLRQVRAVMGTRLRCMVAGSAPTPRALLEDFHALGWTVLEAYGMSENVVPMAMNTLQDFRFGSVGKPVAGNDIAVDEAGSISVRGPGLFHGYLGDPRPLLLDDQGRYRTGDVGQLDVAGHLSLTGRTSELIKTSTGRRIAPLAIEAKLRAVEGIDQVILVGDAQKYLTALCSCSSDRPGSVEIADIENKLHAEVGRLAHWERPLGIVLIERPLKIELGELTPNLKPRRQAVKQQFSRQLLSLTLIVDEAKAMKKDGLVIVKTAGTDSHAE